MPPWKPVPGHGEFLDENRLSQPEIDLLARWADSGAPEGDPGDLPPPLPFSDGWSLGEPDLILEPEGEFAVPPGGADLMRCFSIPTRLLQSRWVAGFEIRPGNRRVVHHAIAFPDPLGVSVLRRESGSGYSCFGGPGIATDTVIGAWAPGTRPRLFPEGVGVRLTPFSRVVLQVHYHPVGTPQIDRTQLGVYFAREPVAKELYYLPLGNFRFTIPAGAERQVVTASLTLPRVPNGVKALSIAPHMHWLGREIRVDATYPDGTRRPLIYIDDWDFNWQTFYYFREPVPLPPGTRLELRAVFDNSAKNPRNPFDPPREVRFGEQSTDEMCLAVLGFVLD
jgi:hypothetical protein